MMRYLILLIILGMVSLGSGPVFARKSSDGAKGEARRERVHQLIVTRLANGLGLSQEEAQKLAHIMKKNKKRKRHMRREVRSLTSQLRQEMATGNEVAIQSTLKKLQNARDQVDRSHDVMFSEVKGLLNPQQQAQFVLIMDEIRHEIRAVRRRGRRRAPSGNDSYQVGPNPGFYKGFQPYGAPQKGTGLSLGIF